MKNTITKILALIFFILITIHGVSAFSFNPVTGPNVVSNTDGKSTYSLLNWVYGGFQNITTQELNGYIWIKAGNGTDLYNKINNAPTGTQVFLPCGTYEIPNTINVIERHVGIRSYSKGNCAIIKPTSTFTDRIMINISDEYFTLSDLSITANNNGNITQIIYADGDCGSYNILNVWFGAYKNQAIYTGTCYYGQIDNAFMYLNPRWNNTIFWYANGSNQATLYGGSIGGDKGIVLEDCSGCHIIGANLEGDIASYNLSEGIEVKGSGSLGVDLVAIRFEQWKKGVYIRNTTGGYVNIIGGRDAGTITQKLVLETGYDKLSRVKEGYIDGLDLRITRQTNLTNLTVTGITSLQNVSMNGDLNMGGARIRNSTIEPDLNNLALYLPFEDYNKSYVTTMNLTVDASKKSNVFVMKGGMSSASFVNTGTGKGLYFNGSQYLRMTTANSGNPLTSFETGSVSMFIYAIDNGGASAGTNGGLISKINGNNDGDQEYGMGYGSGNALRLYLSNGTNLTSYGNPSGNVCGITAGVPQIVGVAFDNATGTINYYRNGQLCDQRTGITGVNIARNSSRDFCIGAQCSSSGSTFWNGTLDEPMVFLEFKNVSFAKAHYEMIISEHRNVIQDYPLSKVFGGTVYGDIIMSGIVTETGTVNNTGTEYHSGVEIHTGNANFTKPIISRNITMTNGTALYCLKVNTSNVLQLVSGGC